MDTGLTNTQTLNMIKNLKLDRDEWLKKAKYIAANEEEYVNCKYYLMAQKLQAAIDELTAEFNLYDAVLGD